MVTYQVLLSKQAVKQIPLLKAAHLTEKAKMLLEVLKEDPFRNPPPYERLSGDLNGLYSRRINHQHRLVYQIFKDTYEVRVLSMWKAELSYVH